MTRYMLQGGALIAVVALVLGGLAFPAGGAENDPAAPSGEGEAYRANETDAALGETLEGRVVNLQQFLLNEPDVSDGSGEASDLKPDRKASKGTPIGLHVENKGMIDALTTERTYLIIFDPDDKTQADAYDSARGLIGKNVTMTGRVLERASISGVLISSVEENSAAQAPAEQQQLQ